MLGGCNGSLQAAGQQQTPTQTLIPKALNLVRPFGCCCCPCCYLHLGTTCPGCLLALLLKQTFPQGTAFLPLSAGFLAASFSGLLATLFITLLFSGFALVSAAGTFFTSEFFSVFGLLVSKPGLSGAEVSFWAGSGCILCTNSADRTSAPGARKREGSSFRLGHAQIKNQQSQDIQLKNVEGLL